MAKTNNTSKLDALTMLSDSLLECCKEYVKNADEWQTFHDWLDKVNDMIHEEHKAQGWSGVYEITDGCAGDCLFEGTESSCKVYTDLLLEGRPELKGNIIISPLN
jgi:hypothetical protein